MRSYKLNIKAIIVIVGTLSLAIFSIALLVFKIADFHGLGEMLMHYGFILAPITVLWVGLDHYLWHTKFMRPFRKSLNIPADMRGRWEGTLENADGSKTQKFVIEVTQTLTHLRVHSYSTIGHSTSILCEIATDSHEEIFTLGYLWEGETHSDIKDMHQGERFQGYTLLTLNEHDLPRTLRGSYFTSRKGAQTRGGIQLTWITNDLKKRFE